MSASELNFLIAARSQIRFDVGAEISVLQFSWWIQGWTHVVVFQHRDGAFILFSLVSTRALYL
jgi:hypothetical protein